MKMTPARQAWLTRLRDIGPANRAKGNVGWSCMNFGWTEWSYRNSEGERMGEDEAKARYGDCYWQRVRIAGEQITDAGMAALEAAEMMHGEVNL